MNDKKICLTLLLPVTSNELSPRVGKFPSISYANTISFLFFLYFAKIISFIESDVLPTKYIYIRPKFIDEHKQHTFVPPFYFPPWGGLCGMIVFRLR